MISGLMIPGLNLFRSLFELNTINIYSDGTGESAEMDLPQRRKRPVKDCGGSGEEWDFALPLQGNVFQ